MKSLRIASLALVAAGLSYSGTLVFNGIDAPIGLGTGTSTNIWINQGGTNFDAYWVGGMTTTVDGHQRILFCIDPSTNIYVGSTNSTILTYPSSTTLKQAAWLLNKEYVNLTNSTYAGVTSQELGASLQLALWQIVAPGNIIASTDPSHPTDPLVVKYATQFYNESAGQSSTNAYVYNNFCTANAPVCGVPSQNLIGLALNDGGPIPAPEPGTFLLMCTGVGLIAVSLIRR